MLRYIIITNFYLQKPCNKSKSLKSRVNVLKCSRIHFSLQMNMGANLPTPNPIFKGARFSLTPHRFDNQVFKVIFGFVHAKN